MKPGEYLRSRIPTLKPTYDPSLNPISLFRTLSKDQFLFFLVGFFAWTWDSFDFFTVTLNYSELSATFGRSVKDITLAVTFALLSRPFGAAIFGIAADRLGRKWPFVVNCTLLIVLELSTGFCYDYNAFLVIRTLFGIAMGGLYGNATATALEDCPIPARGLISGMYQSGYAFGYLLATLFKLAFEKYGWRPLFYFGACPPVFLIIFRMYLPETDTYNEKVGFRHEKSRFHMVNLFQDVKEIFVKHWLLLLYLVLLMNGFSYMSHGSGDLYPALLVNKYAYPSKDVTAIQVVANLGAVLGSWFVGYYSQRIGRRFSIITMCIFGVAFLYPYTYVSGPGIYIAAFLEQFCVQGAFGIIPVHLMELSPIPYRAFVVGTSYNLGILCASASNTVITSWARQYPLGDKMINGETVMTYDYGVVICILMGCTFGYLVFMTAVGPEKKARISEPDELEMIEAGGDNQHQHL